SLLTARILEKLAGIIQRASPELVLVQGDTTTAFSAALAAFYAKIPVAHVEAGLRTCNLHSPFPEEAMRQLISRVATLHFAPTERNARALIAEGIAADRVFVTGNTVIDALFEVAELVRRGERRDFLRLPASTGEKLAGDRHMVLITGHRRENFGSGFERICSAFRELARAFPETLFVYPVHLNPNVRRPVETMLSAVANIELTEPVNYYTFVYLMNRATLIISDSGGVQEEAPSLQKPVFVTRENSERMEIVECGAVKLVGTDPAAIVREVTLALQDQSVYRRMLVDRNPYGDGHAAERIVEILLREDAAKAPGRASYASVPGR
ncbi:MAG TPA: UDP-N-acetylglucosamine 2-epimerase (non-hydrolyzing), partial [Acidobacteriaceae bacterium]|nr:UDP-N-acetylglucosamine 2-epimerase (non-hydrolyzing) [Acidobacteriaceae bacterium]